MSYTRMAFERFQNEYRQPMIVYLHPWEVDPEQPRIPGKLRSRFRHYTNLKRTEGRLDALLRRYRFHRFQDLLSAETASEGCLEVSAAAPR